MKAGKLPVSFTPCDPPPQNKSRSSPVSPRGSPVTIAVLKSATHSQTSPCRSWTPQKFARPEPTGASCVDVGVEYHSSTWCLNSASFSPSGRVGLADAAYSHSATVGKRLPFHWAKALAANHDTNVTGVLACEFAPRSKSPAQFLRYDSSAKIRFTCERRQRGFARRNSRKSPLVTGYTSR